MTWKNYIATLLAACIIIFVFLPCSDVCGSHKHIASNNLEVTHGHHQDASDDCSPFCSCSCCATTMTTNYFPSFQFVPHLSFQKFFILDLVFRSKNVSNIWQPPKFN
jgi:hypothetical protein